MSLSTMTKVRPFVLEALSRHDTKLVGYVFPDGPTQYDPSTQVAMASRGLSFCPSSASTGTVLWDHDPDTKKDD